MPQVLDWYYTHRQPQSSEVPARAHLQQALQDCPLPDPLVAPETARGFYLEPHDLERLDLAQPDGLHDRMRWVRSERGWTRTTLLP
jgi:pyridoxine/pyridoxamine 5'-phosphate oxidase